jgi:hypothetical protein
MMYIEVVFRGHVFQAVESYSDNRYEVAEITDGRCICISCRTKMMIEIRSFSQIPGLDSNKENSGRNTTSVPASPLISSESSFRTEHQVEMTDDTDNSTEPKPHRTVSVVEYQQGASEPEDAGEHEEANDTLGQSEEENDGINASVCC